MNYLTLSHVISQAMSNSHAISDVSKGALHESEGSFQELQCILLLQTILCDSSDNSSDNSHSLFDPDQIYPLLCWYPSKHIALESCVPILKNSSNSLRRQHSLQLFSFKNLDSVKLFSFVSEPKARISSSST